MFAQRHVVNVDDIDELRELRIELTDRGIGPRDDQRHARHGRIVGRRDVERVDVVAAR